MLVDTISDAHVHFHYSSRRFRDVLLANILATQNKNKVSSFLYSFIQRSKAPGKKLMESPKPKP